MLARGTKPNEPARCAVLLPVLAQLPQPLALLDAGASAGLTLLIDRYSYGYAGHHLAGSDPDAPTLRCQARGRVPLPPRVPEIAWRAGLDLSPLDVTSNDDVRWLSCLVWPGEGDREQRLAARRQLVIPPEAPGNHPAALIAAKEPALELALEPFDVAGVLPQLLVGGAFGDAGQGPADGLGPVVRDARGDQGVHDVQLGGLEPDHHVGEFTIGGFAAVFDEPDVTARPVAAVVFGHHLDVPDLGPPLQQVVPELAEPGGDGQLERPGRLGHLAGIGMRILQAGGGIGEDEPGHQLARLHPRCVVVLQQLDPAYPAGEELVRRGFEVVPDVVSLRLVHPPSYSLSTFLRLLNFTE